MSFLLSAMTQDYVQHNLRELLDSNLPNQIGQLEESNINLERVAAFCEANYIQSTNKAAALAETKRFALQSLAGVAYLTGELSRSLLHALELEAINLAQKTTEIQNLSQLIAIQKEKAARREIGKLTANKNVIRQNKIIYPSTEERAPRYQRTPIDFSILDGVGHGRRIVSQSDYGTIGGTYHAPIGGQVLHLNRTGSNASGDSASTGGPPIYEHYARTGYGTLARGSVRSSAQEQYRVPQAIPSAALHQHPRPMHCHQPMHTNGNGNPANANGHYADHHQEQQYGTLRAQQVRHHHEGSRSQPWQVHNSADYPDDGLPLPPPLVMGNAQHYSNSQHHDDLPPPPDPIGGQRVQEAVPEWVPHEYIEKAVVLYDYDARSQDELHLYQGALVYVLRKNDDGWFEGVMDGITGLFPGNYVKPL